MATTKFCKATITRRKNGWPQTCSKPAHIRGYCVQHAVMNPPVLNGFYRSVEQVRQDKLEGKDS
jgi:hypothetical protein